MVQTTPASIGLVLGSAIPPEDIGPSARRAEALGFDEIWLAEDMFFTGGIAGATSALAATERIRVGLGIVSAVVRHPALLAVELATIARSFPGRLTAGIGLGVPTWMRQMGLMPSSPLRAVGECVRRTRQLLAGETVTSAPGDHFHFDHVTLAHPVDGGLPIHTGVLGPKMLELSGEAADGTILSVCAGVEYLRFARRHIDAGRSRTPAGADHRVTQFALSAVSDDRQVARNAARDALGFYLLSGGANAMTDAAGISDQLRELQGLGLPVEELLDRIPDEWVDRLTASGSAGDVRARIAEYHEAGADAVALFPVPVPGATLDGTVDALGAACRMA